jgi:hypothetical protein
MEMRFDPGSIGGKIKTRYYFAKVAAYLKNGTMGL